MVSPNNINIPNQIVAFLHCARCLKEKPEDQSPKEWARTQTGWTSKGFQIWCTRHDLNVGYYELIGAMPEVELTCGHKLKGGH